MRRTLASFCAALMMFGLASCNGSNEVRPRSLSALNAARSSLAYLAAQESLESPRLLTDIDCGQDPSGACLDAVVQGLLERTVARLYHALDVFSIGIALCSPDRESEREATTRADLRVVRVREELMGRSALGMAEYLSQREEAVELINSLVEELENCPLR